MKTTLSNKTTKQARKYKKEENRMVSWVDVQVEYQTDRIIAKLENEDYYRHLANEIRIEKDMGGDSAFY